MLACTEVSLVLGGKCFATADVGDLPIGKTAARQATHCCSSKAARYDLQGTAHWYEHGTESSLVGCSILSPLYRSFTRPCSAAFPAKPKSAEIASNGPLTTPRW